MRLNLAFTFFSDEVLGGLCVCNSHVEDHYGIGCTKATLAFVSVMRDLIDAMMPRHSKQGLRAGSKEAARPNTF